MSRKPASFAAALWVLSTLALAQEEESPGAGPALNYKVAVRCEFGSAPEKVFRLTDADGEFSAEHPDPPILFEGRIERREGAAFVLRYAIAWRQDLEEAPAETDAAAETTTPRRPKFGEGTNKGLARLALGVPVRVYDADRVKVTLELTEVPDLVGRGLRPVVDAGDE